MTLSTLMPKHREQQDEERNTPKTTTGRDHIVNMNVTALTPTNRVVLFEDFIEAEQSSVEETMGIVSNKDDYTMPCLTVDPNLTYRLGLGCRIHRLDKDNNGDRIDDDDSETQNQLYSLLVTALDVQQSSNRDLLLNHLLSHYLIQFDKGVDYRIL
ncbi:unnamed protein product [Didymodactylos carnosus]|uniref:Uncharacterized protein n=1 Tax=Didymodactylos carnosus TaxID=1234261 RepID=A0A815N9J9_9BILA|nr:unnamed protein product [Didymodactylos carnosus]CAF4312089.1 unnamed protein product [Didymodactylos carnosus]